MQPSPYWTKEEAETVHELASSSSTEWDSSLDLGDAIYYAIREDESLTRKIGGKSWKGMKKAYLWDHVLVEKTWRPIAIVHHLLDLLYIDKIRKIYDFLPSQDTTLDYLAHVVRWPPT